MKLSAVIITYNEENNIGRCVDSLIGVADEILVVDSFSKDKTEIIATTRGARFIQNKFEGHIQQKNYAMQQAEFDYIISLDADEALNSQLRSAILEFKKSNQFLPQKVKRLTNYCGHWVRFCGWYPDKKLRIFDRRKGAWTGMNPHDRFELFEPHTEVNTINGKLLHYSFYTIQDHFRQVEYFTDIAANAIYKKGKKPGFHKCVFNPLWTFIRMYIIKLGFLDGWRGLQICSISAYATFIKYKKTLLLFKKT